LRKFLVLLFVSIFAVSVPFAGVASAGGLPCPPASPGAGKIPPNCGHGKGGGGGGGSGGHCGAKDAGGSPPGGPVTDVVWMIGAGISDGGLVPVGDFVQNVSCPVHDLTGL